MIGVVFNDGDASFATTCSGPEDLEGIQTMQVSGTPEGTLALGSTFRTLAEKDNLLLTFNRPQTVVIREGRVSVDSQEKICVGALNNSRSELLPVRFSTWPSWAQELWRWMAISVTSATALGALRKYTGMPS